MNKVVNINMGGIPFTLDEDAYAHLQNYLDAIHRHFKSNEGYREITNDIEARLAELFQERLDRRSIVNLNDVEEAISIMGKPEDFGAEPLEQEAARKESSSSTYRTGRRLFRNTDDSVVAGVCAGVSAYFGIQDPIWIRLLFVVLTLSGAFGIPIYIVLWILMPEAKSASDKLAMRGEPINVSNIGRVIQEEVNSFSEGMSQFSKDWTDGSGKAKSGPGDIVRRIVQSVGAVLVAIGEFLIRVGRPLLILVGIILMLSLALAWAGTVIGFFTAWPTLKILSPAAGLSNVLLPMNILFLVGVPLIGLVLFIARVVFGTRIARGWGLGLMVFWGLNLASLFAVGSRLGSYYSEKGFVQKDIFLSPRSSTLHLAAMDVNRADALFDIEDKVEVAKGQLFFRSVDLRIRPSENDQWLLRQECSSRGRTAKEAEELARGLDWEVEYDEQHLRIPEGYVMRRGQGWRNQEVHLTLYMPLGSRVTFDQRTAEMLRDTELSGGRRHPADESDHSWIMTQNGLECEGCQIPAPEVLGQTTTRKGNDYGPYDALRLEGPARLSLEKGEQHRFQMQGPQKALDGAQISKKGNELIIRVPESSAGEGLRFYLAAPSLKVLSLNETGDVRLRGFALDSLRIYSRGEQQIKAELDAQTLIIEQNGKNELDLKGAIGSLRATMNDHARLDVDEAELEQAQLQLSHHSQAVLPPSARVQKNTDESSRVYQQ